ncbi:MAG: ABC transporter substrate-binding protein [Acetobacteraceae bacterium]
MLGAAWAMTAGAAMAAGPPIKIGDIEPYSGSLAPFGIEVARGHQIAADQINKAGGLLGRQIVLIRGDATNPQQGIATVDQLATRDKVDLFTGCYTSPVSNSASDAALRYNLLFWETNSTAQDLTDRNLPNYVRSGPSATSFAVVAADTVEHLIAPAFKRDPKTLKVWIEHENLAFGTSIATVLDKLLRKDGIVPLGIGAHSYTSIDLNDTLLRIKQARPDLLIQIGYVPDDNLLLKTMRDQNYKTKALMFVGQGDDDATLKTNGKAGVEGLLSVSYPRTDLAESYGPGGAAYAAAYRARYHEAPQAAQGMSAYDGFLMMGEAINAAGSMDPVKVRAAAAKMDKPMHSYAGGYGVKFDAHFQNVRALPTVIQWQDGKQIVVWPEAARHPGAELRDIPAQ